MFINIRQLAIVFVRYIQVILLIWRVLRRWRQTSKANGVYDTINRFACNFAKCSLILKFLHQEIEWHICNEVTHHNLNACYTTHTHTHTRLTALFPGCTQVGRYQKGKTKVDFTEARDSEWQWHQLGHMQVCTLFQTDNHTSTSPLSFLQAGCHFCRPANSVKALKAMLAILPCHLSLTQYIFQIAASFLTFIFHMIV